MTLETLQHRTVLFPGSWGGGAMGEGVKTGELGFHHGGRQIPEEGVTDCSPAGATWIRCLQTAIKWSFTGWHTAIGLAAKVVSVAFGSARVLRVKFGSTVIGDKGGPARPVPSSPYC